MSRRRDENEEIIWTLNEIKIFLGDQDQVGRKGEGLMSQEKVETIRVSPIARHLRILLPFPHFF